VTTNKHFTVTRPTEVWCYPAMPMIWKCLDSFWDSVKRKLL